LCPDDLQAIDIKYILETAAKAEEDLIRLFSVLIKEL
jgi:hypothetical protein